MSVFVGIKSILQILQSWQQQLQLIYFETNFIKKYEVNNIV